jgi:hypothetical protein
MADAMIEARIRIELVASFENHANLLLWLGNTDSGAGLHTLHTRSLHQERIDTTCCNHADARPSIRNGVLRISLTSLEGMQTLAYPLSPVRRFRVTENSQPVPHLEHHRSGIQRWSGGVSMNGTVIERVP